MINDPPRSLLDFKVKFRSLVTESSTDFILLVCQKDFISAFLTRVIIFMSYKTLSLQEHREATLWRTVRALEQLIISVDFQLAIALVPTSFPVPTKFPVASKSALMPLNYPHTNQSPTSSPTESVNSSCSL